MSSTDNGNGRTRGISIYLATVACILSVCGMLAGNAGQEMIVAAIDSSNYYAWMQAKTIREAAGEVPGGKTRDELRALGDRRSMDRAKASEANNLYSIAQTLLSSALAIGAAALLAEGWMLIAVSWLLACCGVGYMVLAMMIGWPV
jgi:hypothetical protein